MPSFLLPWHNYSGSRNLTVNRPHCDAETSAADNEHCSTYEIAQTSQDIRDADRREIRDFAAPGSFASYVGAFGLSAKYALESVTGRVYPSGMSDFPSSSTFSKPSATSAPRKCFASKQ